MPISEKEMLLVQLVEECAEVIQEVCKAQRFGVDEKMEGINLTNLARITKELNDLQVLTDLVAEAYDINRFNYLDIKALSLKKQKVIKYMNYSKDCGMVAQ